MFSPLMSFSSCWSNRLKNSGSGGEKTGGATRPVSQRAGGKIFPKDQEDGDDVDVVDDDDDDDDVVGTRAAQWRGKQNKMVLLYPADSRGLFSP